MLKYDSAKTEKKWQKSWVKQKLYKTGESSKKPKYYVLDMFPYPSGAGLHVGHPKGYIATDVVARMKMMQGFNVLHPMGWDAFGLPAENYAIKNKVHPATAMEKNVKVFKKQLELLGFTYDWDREVNTTDPEYYKWTQWAFLQMFKHGLAYESNEPVNWCPSCKTVLANEDLENGKCERCGSEIEQKPMRQWVLKITDYADRLLKDIDKLSAWPGPIREMQKNWIGRSEGAEVNFAVIARSEATKQSPLGDMKVFTTRPDTLFGATYTVIAPEHELLEKLKNKINNWAEVQKYIESAKRKTTLERAELQKEKTGVELKGIKAINPVNNEELPIFIADYVLTGYGTGAIMAVPAHDERDFEFANKYNLPIKQVIAPYDNFKSVVITETLDNPIDFKKELQKKEIHFELAVSDISKREHIRVDFKKEKLEDFIKIVQQYIKQNSWVEILGSESILVLKDEVHKNFLSQSDKWFKVFFEWEPHVRGQKNLWDMLAKNTFLNNLVCYRDDGVLINSKEFSGLASEEARRKITEFVGGKMVTKFKLRDWVFSRQRYWGEPIPLVKCEVCKNKKQKVLLIHGLYGKSTENWFPWFKKEMERKGCEVLIPDLPGNGYPTLEQWLEVLEKLNIKKEDRLSIVGHSLGAPAACQFILKNKLKVEKLILVAPTGVAQKEENWENLRKIGGCDEENLECIRKFNQANRNLAEVKKLVSESVIYLSDNDPYIPMEVAENYQELNVKVQIFKNKGHFNARAGILQFPEILKELLDNNGWVPVPESELPLKLPDVKNYEPSGTGESPLSQIDKWVNTKCPQCGGPAKRETNTMPQWAGSCWYYLRYCDPKNKKSLIDKDIEKYWNPVDLYVGGAEHATRHLIYARFWHKFLFDIGVVSNDEPFTKLQNVGLILAEDGRKMSKRWGNVINPDEIVGKFGADAMRVYEMFMGPFDQPCAWSTNGVIGCRRFLEKVWNLQDTVIASEAKQSPHDGIASSFITLTPRNDKTETLLHQTIKKVTEDIGNMRFNTAVAQLMILANELNTLESISNIQYPIFLQLLSPFAPHVCEEIWEKLGNKNSIFTEPWPQYDLNKIKDETITLAVQVNGKLRDTLEVSADISEADAKQLALSSEKVQKWLEGKEPKKVIYVKSKLISIVV